MEIVITRMKFDKGYTEGVLSIDGDNFCDTIEDVVRAGEKVYGKTAIPAGRYRLIMSYSNRFKKVMPLLINVPGFEGIRIHSGNTASDTEGCIIVGKKDAPGHVRDSRITYGLFINELESDKTEHWITVK